MGQSQRRDGGRDHRLPEDLTVLRADDDTGSQRQRETGPTGSRRPGGRRRKRRPGPSAERNARRRQRRRRRRERVGGVARRPSWRELENHPCRPEPVTQERASSAIPTRGASRPRISASLPVRAPRFPHTLACRPPAPHFTRRFTSKHPRPDRPRGGGSPEVWRSAAPAPLGRQLSPRGPRTQLASFSYNALQSIQMFTGNTVDGRTS
ncbi:uncharacterized protein [Tursiops truncatus]|uniref:U1 small nuclear ribonucleoprotein 70 kDa-like n=1 Tax=Tursiops truncatus TaxID=9739 RepID=A0A6J3RNJ6_TURTR|nr:U1 small nuclear ribonucleoprotein 70 kDa-like [Tursiops truncatus]